MTLNLKRGPKDRIWTKARITHRDDNGKTYVDEFDVQIRTPSDVADILAESEMIRGEADQADATNAKQKTDDYLRRNVLDWRNLMDADDKEVPFSPDVLGELISITPYRAGLVRLVLETRAAPAEAERKN